jgi:thioredoxin 1
MTGNPIKTVTDQTFAAEVLDAEGPVLVDFWASWCGPCRLVAPVLEEIARERDGELTVAKLNIDENEATAERYQVMSIPFMGLFEGGRMVKSVVGARPKAAILSALGM